MLGQYISDLAMSWHLVMPSCSPCNSYRNDSLRAVKMTVLEHFRSTPLFGVSSSLILAFVVYYGYCLCVAGHALCMNL